MPSFDFGSIFTHLFQGALSELLYCKIRIQNSLKCAFWLTSKEDSSSWAILCCPVKMLSLNHPLRITKQDKPCICYTLFFKFSNMATNQATVNPHVPVTQIEGLGLHVVNITRYVIRIKKHLHNRIEIIEIESNRKEYELLHHYWVDVHIYLVRKLIHCIRVNRYMLLFHFRQNMFHHFDKKKYRRDLQ